MKLSIAQYLTSSGGEKALSSASTLLEQDIAPHAALAKLQALALPEEARAIWELANLRLRAQAKFGIDADCLFFDREALEMATPARVARYHAKRFSDAGSRHLLDLGGGIGADSLAFARVGIEVTLVERDPARAHMAQANSLALGLEDRIDVICAEATTVPVPPAADAAFLDPARRSVSRRWAGSLEEIEPPLSLVKQLQERGIHVIGVKLSPAIPHEVAGQYDAEVEFISQAGECKEAFLAIGALRTGHPTSAVLLSTDGEERLTGDAADRCPSGPPAGRYLYEPDPAVIRAHLVGTLAVRIQAWQFDPQIAYLIGNELIATPFAQAYEIHESLSYNRRAVQEALRRRGIGRVTIKKRGFPEELEAVRKQLRLSGNDEAVLILTRCGKRHWAFVANRVDTAG